MPASGAAEIDVEGFRAFEQAGWESVGKAVKYESAWGPITRRTVGPLLEVAGVRPDSHVLDVATGPGYVAAAASRRGAVVVGVDIATSMVSLARRLHPGIEFRHSPAERLPFPDGSFDAVVGNFIIIHLAEPEKAVAEACRVLKPGGRAAFTLWDTPGRARFLGVLLDAVATIGAKPPGHMPPGPPIFQFADDPEFRRLLLTAGLIQPRVRSLRFLHRFRSSDELWNCLVFASVRLGALVLGQPSLVQQRIRDEFERNTDAYVTSSGLELPVSVKLGVAQKR
jgi:SAM-dependent methyltransferase